MEFLFFNAQDKVLFSRCDAETAEWNVEDLGFTGLFPHDSEKVIQNGMRIGFTDETGNFQAFEIRKCRDYEPDHYQEVTAEHIAVSELTDEHLPAKDWEDVTAGEALTQALTGTLWAIGTNTASNLSSAKTSNGDVWQAVRTIESNWNVYIIPRITVNASGITGRYLDIQPAAGTFHGMRLSLDKNADEVGVTWDDSQVKTAMYGYGANVEVEGEEENQPLSFASVVWTETSDHPAKPSGQTYIESPAATAAYGRNGRARFGFYQNADIDDPEVLLEKTWESLQAVMTPDVSVDCLVHDLYRLGYADTPIQLHDMALLEVRQTGVLLAKEIIGLTVNLLDPTATRVKIGSYIPNIIYIAKEIEDAATGGGGGGGSGQSNAEYELQEFETEIKANRYEISLRAYQRDMNNVEEILRQAGISINAQGVLVYAEDNQNMLGSKFRVNADAISAEVTNRQNADSTLSSRITQTADSITAEVTRAETAEGSLSSRITQTATDITSLVTKTGVNSLGPNDTLYSKINQNAESITTEVTNRSNADSDLSSRITQNANSISLVVSNGAVDAASIVAAVNSAGSSVKITASHIILDGQAVVNSLEGYLLDVYGIEGTFAQFDTIYVGSGEESVANAIMSFGTATESGGQITIPTVKLSGNAGPDINFNIAATQYYQDGVAAAETTGWNAARAMVEPPAQGDATSFTVKVPSATQNQQQTYTFTIQKGQTPGSSGYASVALAGVLVGRIEIGSWYDAGVTAGAAGVTLSASGWTGPSGTNTVTASNGQSVAVRLPTFTSSQSAWTSEHKKTVGFATASVSAALKTETVDASGIYSDGEAAGAASVTLGDPVWGSATSNSYNTFTVTASNDESVSQGLYLYSAGWSSGSRYVYMRTGSASGTSRARISVSMPDASDATWSWSNPAQGYAKASITIGGKTYSNSHQIPSSWM